MVIIVIRSGRRKIDETPAEAPRRATGRDRHHQARGPDAETEDEDEDQLPTVPGLLQQVLTRSVGSLGNLAV